ncbi:MAG: hypothetical protein ACXV8Q_04760 [Methylobacter sp.]
MVTKYRAIEEAPTFGLFHLTTNKAAELIVLDMWYSGDIPDVSEPDNWDGCEYDPILNRLLSDHTEKFKEKLISAINKGTLKADIIKRDFDEQLIPEETYLDSGALEDWLEERNFTPGDIWSDWFSQQNDIVLHVGEEISYLQALVSSGKKVPVNYPLSPLELDYIAESADIKLQRAFLLYKEITIENQRLREQLKNNELNQNRNKVDRPLTTRQRKTLLTIIAALCSFAKIDPQARGASQRIRELTESLGAPVDDGTIKTLLSEIPDALDARMK